MLSRLTGGLRPWQLSLEGKLHETQPPASIGVAAQALGQNGRPLVEPGSFFVDGSYGLRINSWNSLAGVTVTVRMRFLGSDGRIRDNEWTHTPNTNRTKATSDFPLGVGFPLNITAFASAGAPLFGQTFVQVQLISGLGGATTLLATLLQDYLTAQQALAYPGSPIRSSLDGQGAVRYITGTAPAAGAQISEAVPTGARWEILAFTMGLTTNGAAGNRQVMLQITNGALNFMTAIANGQIGPGTTALAISFGPAGNSLTDVLLQFFTGSIPVGIKLIGGAIIATGTDNFNAADQFTAPHYIVKEWLEAA